MGFTAMSDENVNVIAVPNPFRLASRKNYSVPAGGKTVADMLAGQILADHVRLSVNGMEIRRDRFGCTLLRPGDSVVIMPMVADLDDGIIGAVMMIAITLASAPIAAGFGFGATGTFLAQAGIILAGGMLISAMNAQSYKAPNMGDMEGMEQSYGWNPHTVQRQGGVIPKHYGETRVFGNMVACHTEVVVDEDAQTLEAVIALGMGPIESISDVRLNDQPMANYADVSTENKLGTIAQTAISLFSDTKPEFRPNIKVVNGTPVTYTTPDDDFDDIEIDLYFSKGIYWANDSRGLSNHSVGIKIEVSIADADSWTTIAEETVTAATTGQLWKSYLVSDELAIVNGNKYDIKVTKTTSDEGARYGDDVYLGGVREVLEDGFRYPRTALVGVSALATGQLSGNLKFSCVVEGSIVNTYNGSAWTLQYSNNPAWVIFDLVTKPVISGDGGGTAYAVERYDGLNPTRIDIAQFYVLAQMCDDMVNDGKGSTEKRITFNGSFETETNVWDAIFTVCEIARCVPVWNGTQLTLAIDEARSVVGAYTVGNIEKEQFEVEYMAKADRASEIVVNYRDAGQDYKKQPFTVYNASAGGAGNKVTLDLEMITKQSEAWRYGLYRLAQNQLLKRRFTWTADIDALPYTVGDRIKLQHDVLNFGEIGSGSEEYNGGGVIASVNLAGADDIITLDRDISGALDGGETYELLVKLADDTVETMTVKSWSGAAITLDGTFSGSPAADDIWAIGLENQVADDVQIVDFERTGKFKHRVVATDYDADIYANDSGTPVLPAPNISTPGGDAGSILRTPTLAELNAWYPSALMGVPTMDIPITHNITWNDDTPSGGSISWSATDGTGPLLFTLKGVTYEITAGNTANSYVYWHTGATTVFTTSNSLGDAIGATKWLMAFNDSGTAQAAWGKPIIHAGMINADSLSAITAALGSITSGTITLSLGGDTRLRINSDGMDISENAGSDWTPVIENDGGTVYMYADILKASEIITEKINNEATEIMDTEVTAGAVTLTTSYQTVATANITSLGGQISIEAGCVLEDILAGTSRATMQITGPSGTLIETEVAGSWETSVGNTVQANLKYLDTPGAGSRTYNFQLKESVASHLQAQYRTIKIRESKGK